DSNNSVHAEILSKLKRRLRTETFTSDYIFEIINEFPDLIRSLYLHFANVHYVQTRGEKDDFLPTLSYQRINVGKILGDEQIRDLITKTVSNEHQEIVMGAFQIFNTNVL